MGDVGLIYQIAPDDFSPEGVQKLRDALKTVPEIKNVQEESLFGATIFKILVVVPDKTEGALEAALNKLRAIDCIEREGQDPATWEPTLKDQTLIN